MNEGINRARILIEALPYIRQFNGQTMVIKYDHCLPIELPYIG